MSAKSEGSPPDTPTPSRGERLLLSLLLVAAAALAYSSSFGGVFLFDDPFRLEEAVERWEEGGWRDPFAGGRVIRRPVTEISLVANHALSGDDPWSYHLFNLAVHVGSGLLLFGLVRRTLLLPRFGERFRPSASRIAAAAALLWLVHPLTTQAVTYVIQRGESLMALFYLATLYCLVRCATAERRGWAWGLAAVFACQLGMGSKPVMVTAPLCALLFEWTFLGRWLRSNRLRRAIVHAGLWGTLWFLFASNVVQGTLSTSGGAAHVGFRVSDVTPFRYLLTQSEVVLHYLRLAFWPQGLVLDYGWSLVDGWRDVVVEGTVVVFLVLASLVGLARRHWAGFAGFAAFLVLAPTSSFIPIKDPAFEHRAYLPLAALVVLVVGTAWDLLRRLADDQRHATRSLSIVCLVVAAVLGTATYQRNLLYHSEDAMWRDILAKRPESPRALSNVGVLLSDDAEGQDLETALENARRALEKDPDNPDYNYNVAVALDKLGRYDEAEEAYRRTLRLTPGYAKALHNLAVLLFEHRDQPDAAMSRIQRALLANPERAESWYTAGLIHLEMGVDDQALASFERALEHDPENLGAEMMKARALESMGRLQEAEAVARSALAKARAREDRESELQILTNIGTILFAQGRYPEAGEFYQTALELDPESHVDWYNIGCVYEVLGNLPAAEQSYRRSLALEPTYQQARRALASLRGR